MIVLPILDANDSLLEIEIEGATVFVRMSWNSEGEFWSMSLENFEHTVLIAGIRVVADSPLLGMWHYLIEVPAGEIWCVLMDSTRQDLTRRDFADGTAFLVYLEAGERVEI